MNISDQYRCIFVHIPKAAGTSIKQVLGMPGSGHQPWHFFASNFPEKWDSYVKFSVVRNPWERLVSSYTYARAERSFWHDKDQAPHPDYELVKDLEFEAFCDLIAHEREALRHESWHPQYPWVAGRRDDEVVLMVPEILRCEHLEGDFAALCGRLGVAPVALPRLNTSDHGGYQDYYNDRTRKLVEKIYAMDIDLFRYTF